MESTSSCGRVILSVSEGSFLNCRRRKSCPSTPDMLLDDGEDLLKIFWRYTKLHQPTDVNDNGFFFQGSREIKVIPDPLKIRAPDAPFSRQNPQGRPAGRTNFRPSDLAGSPGRKIKITNQNPIRATRDEGVIVERFRLGLQNGMSSRVGS